MNDNTNTAQRPGFWKRLLRRPSIFELVLTGLWLLCAFFFLSNVEIDLGPMVVLLFSAMALAAVWGLRVLILLALLMVRHKVCGLVLPWLALPAAFVLALTAAKTNLDLRVRLRLSEPALRQYAATLAPGVQEDYAEPGKRVGLFWVTRAENVNGCCRFTTASCFFEQAGVAYCPQGEPPRDEKYTYWHIRGPWYRWFQGWD